MYIQVNIGRNIDNVPMQIQTWLSFQSSAVEAIIISANELRGTISPKIEIHLGSGSWTEDDGTVIREDSAKIGVFSESGFDLDTLRSELASIRDRFGQDSIALITESELI